MKNPKLSFSFKHIFNNFLLSIIFFIGLTLSSYAHLEAGEDKAVGGYIVDFGYSPKNPTYDEKVIFAFNLLNASTSEVIEPESVWVRISNKEQVVFSGTFKPEAQHVAFIYKFPGAGEYVIEPAFKNNGISIAESEFSITIKQPKYYYIIYSIIIVLGIAVLILIASLVKMRKKG